VVRDAGGWRTIDIVSVLVAHVLAFAAAAFVLAMAPGPATAVLLRQTVRHGRRRGLATIAGIEAGVALWAVAAAFGLSALVAASGIAYTAMRFVGAAVLVALGVQAFRRSRRAPGDSDGVPGDPQGAAAESLTATSAAIPSALASPPDRRRDDRRAARTGLVTNLANPKAGVFAISFLPQFIPAHAAVLPTGLLLAGVWVACDCAWYLVLVSAIQVARQWFYRAPVRQRLEQLSGAALIGFGIRLALQVR
jgi:threonine/homoserine/homoserine lactone efflux protein